LLIPTELTVEFVHVEVNGEVGRNFVEGQSDGWIFGMSTESGIRKRLELLAEVHGERIDRNATELFANIGARPKLTRRLILLLATGRTLLSSEDGPRAYLYAGLQLNLPGQFAFMDATHGRWVAK
jgi:hypothetical protein